MAVPEEFALDAGARLVLDPEGLHVRRPSPMVDLEGPWEDLYAVRVERVDGVPKVSVTFVDGLTDLVEGRSPATATRFDLSGSSDHSPEELVVMIERSRRAWLTTSAPSPSAVATRAAPRLNRL